MLVWVQGTLLQGEELGQLLWPLAASSQSHGLLPVVLWQWRHLEAVRSQLIPAQGFLQQVIFARGSPRGLPGTGPGFSEELHNKQSPPSLPAKPPPSLSPSKRLSQLPGLRPTHLLLLPRPLFLLRGTPVHLLRVELSFGICFLTA